MGYRDPRFGTLAMYPSSTNVQRYYCSACSSHILYANEEQPDATDIPIGVMETPFGARAENLLEWDYGVVYYVEDCEGTWREKLTTAIKEGSEEWRLHMHIAKSFRRAVAENQESGAAVQADKHEQNASTVYSLF